MSELLDIEKAAQRPIKSIAPYLHLIPKPDFVEVIHKDGNVKKTVGLMKDIVFKYLDDTKLLAPTLKGKSLEETCRNVWEFWYSHVQYKLDTGEQLRRPARTLYEQMGDCDCFSIGVCSTLLNLHIDCNFSIAKYKEASGTIGNWQHVYVTVPKANGGYYTLDCVAHNFNQEQSYADKFNFHMTTLHGIPISVLSGFGNSDDELFKILSGADFLEVDTLLGLGKTPSAQIELDAIYKHLISTRNYIQQNPQSVVTTGGAAAHLQMLNHAIDNWHTPNRIKALELLEQEEERWNEHNGANSLGNFEDEDEINGLGAAKVKKKFWGKIKDAVKDAGQGAKKKIKKVGEQIKKVEKKVEEGVKKIIKGILRYNPLSLAVRGGFLLAMKINLLDMGGHLYPAYLSEAEIKSKGISSEKWEKAKRALAKIEKMFVDVLQGKADKLKSAIITGRAKKHFAGFGSLGEPATITSVIASATPIIAAAKSINGEGANDTGEQLPESKESLIAKVKEWWKKIFGKENAIASETVSDEEKAPNDNAKEENTSGDEKTNERTANPDGEESGWMKFKQFVSDNTGTIAIGVLAAGTIVTLLVVHHNKKKEEQKEGGQPRQLPQPETKQLTQAMSGHKRKTKKFDSPNILK